MTVSYNWLQSFFTEKLPAPEKVAGLLTEHSFEVESFEKKGDDTIFEIDILPNRAHDCLSHRGIARELSAILDFNLNIKHLGVTPLSTLRGVTPKLEHDLSIIIKNEKLCPRYIGRVIENIKVGPSPDWLKKRLESIGQKSINNIVDVTNYVMFELGQPMHAFDADKVDIKSDGINPVSSADRDMKEIMVRHAENGEKIKTLDGKIILLNHDMLVIADGKEPLALAGVKGGIKAEVTQKTKNIILESANFEPSSIRCTVQKTGIRTDSSKRFEQGVAPELARDAMDFATELIFKIAGEKEIRVGDIRDQYPRPAALYKVGVSLEEINSFLGLSLCEEEVKSIFSHLRFQYEIVEPIKKVLELALAFIETPYHFGASIVYDAPRAFDCSSFTAYLFAQVGVSIPRVSVDQYVFGKEVSIEEISSGDIVFSNSGQGKLHTESVEFFPGIKIPEGIDHCGLYLGDGMVIHASRYNGTGKVMIEKLRESKVFSHIIGARRMYNGGKRFVITVPHERLDIRVSADLIEEVGRLYGYSNIRAVLPHVDKKEDNESATAYENIIKKILSDNGFSEIYTYTFVDRDNIGLQMELENPLAEDKAFLRQTLNSAFHTAMLKNAYYADLLGISLIKIFEIGRVFKNNSEEETLGVGIKRIKKNKKEMKAEEILLKEIRKFFEELGIQKELIVDGDVILNQEEMSAFIEIPLQKIISQVDKEKIFQKYTEQDIFSQSPNVSYKPLSQYPFVGRDISLFVSRDILTDIVKQELSEAAGDLLAQIFLFDTFEKDNKKSYAFRLVFQSYEKTLSDEEVNKIMENIYDRVNYHKWEVR